MAISREKKEKIVENLTNKFRNSVVCVLTNYSGLNVEEMSKLRQSLQEKEVEYKIAKNNLFLLALKNAGIKPQEEIFNQPIGIALGKNDEVEAPKAVNEFSKKNENLKIIGGIIEGKFVSKEEILNLASLPEKEESYSKIVGSLVSPLQGLLNVLQGNLKGLVIVLNQYKNKLSNTNN